MKLLLRGVGLAVVLFATGGSQGLVSAAEPASEPVSGDYQVWVNGVKAQVYVARVQDPPWEKTRAKLDFGGNYSFTSFDLSGPAAIRIVAPEKSLAKTIIRPEHAKIDGLKQGEKELSFTIDQPVKLSIEPDGKNGPLLLFANPRPDYHYADGDKNVRCFGPGIHKPEGGRLTVGDNQILFLAEGAVVKAGVTVSGNNAMVCGRGMLDGNEFVWGKGPPNMVRVSGSNVVIKDIILRGGATWMMPLRDASHVTIDNVKILGGRAQNDDGINPCNAQDVVIRNCFIRTDDDCLALKGMQANGRNVERITVENCILWCDRARVFLLGHESRAEYMCDLVFRDIDIIHYSPRGHCVFLLEPGEEMKLQNVLFENIRIHGEGQQEFLRLKPTVNQYMRKQVPGHIANVTFKNITVTGQEGAYKIQLIGSDEQHGVSGVTMSGVSLIGNRLKSGAKNLEIGQWVENVSIK